MIGRDSPSIWKTICVELATNRDKKSERYWMKVYNDTKERTSIKADLLGYLRKNKMEIASDLQMTENENRILDILEGKKLTFDEVVKRDDDEEEIICRICLERGTDFIRLFNGQHETPSITDKLLECSRISQVHKNLIFGYDYVFNVFFFKLFRYLKMMDFLKIFVPIV